MLQRVIVSDPHPMCGMKAVMHFVCQAGKLGGYEDSINFSLRPACIGGFRDMQELTNLGSDYFRWFLYEQRGRSTRSADHQLTTLSEPLPPHTTELFRKPKLFWGCSRAPGLPSASTASSASIEEIDSLTIPRTSVETSSRLGYIASPYLFSNGCSTWYL